MFFVLSFGFCFRAGWFPLQVDFETGVPLSRDLVDWHQAAGQELYQRLASMSINASAENWPFRVNAMNNMLRHFSATFQQKLQEPASPQEQLRSKLQAVREEAEIHRLRAGQRSTKIKADQTARDFETSFSECQRL